MREWLANNWGNAASVLGLGISLVALWLANSAKRLAVSLERHQDAVGTLRAIHQCQFHVNELQRTTGSNWPRSRCDALAESLAAVEVRRAKLSEPERHALDRFTASLHRGDVKNDEQAAGRLRALVSLLAKLDDKFATVARSEVMP